MNEGPFEGPFGSCSLFECCRRLINKGLEGLRLLDSEIGKYFPVNLDARELEAVNKSPINEAVLTHAGVYALNPQCAEIAFPVLAIAIAILPGFFNSLDGGTEGILPASVIAFRSFDYLAVTGVLGDAPFDT